MIMMSAVSIMLQVSRFEVRGSRFASSTAAPRTAAPSNLPDAKKCPRDDRHVWRRRWRGLRGSVGASSLERRVLYPPTKNRVKRGVSPLDRSSRFEVRGSRAQPQHLAPQHLEPFPTAAPSNLHRSAVEPMRYLSMPLAAWRSEEHTS